MVAFDWRKWFRQQFCTTRRSIRRRPTRRLNLEKLEERWVPSITATGQNVSMIEGTANPVLLATFTDTDPSPVGDYSVSINWGDGTGLDTTSATVSQNGNTYFITASHTYAEETPAGTPNAVTVNIAESNGSDTDTATANSTANVADAALTPIAKTIMPAEGAAFSGTVAAFTDADPNGTASDYSATINWGDGSTTTGTIAAGTGNTFNVNGTHTYPEDGTYSVTVTILDQGGSSTIAHSTANVTETDLNVTASSFSAAEGTALTNVQVATFTDTGSAPSDTFSATIDWGDGSTSSGTVTFSTTLNAFVVTGSHTYADEGNVTVTTTVTETGVTPSSSASVAITVADQDSLTVNALPVSAAENAPFSGVVANVTDTFDNSAADFTASISWGDGSTTTGIIAKTGTGAYTVSGTHTYAEEGTYPITVTFTDDAAGAASASGSSTAAVSDPAVMGTGGFTVTAVEGSSSGPQTVATFTDPAGPEALSNYSATIAWGDGSTSAGSIAFNSTNSTFTVSGSHTYAEEGNPTITVTIKHDTAPNTVVTSSAQVSDPSVVATGGFTVTAAEGSGTGTQTLATFTDPGGPEALTDYSATVQWGDGSSSTGSITFNMATGVFTVSGSHTYTEEGGYGISVTINHDSASPVTVNDSATVSDPGVVAFGGATLSAVEGSSTGTQNVAAFIDPAGPEAVSNYSATINWGDNSTSAGTITVLTGLNFFLVSGSHTYAEEGTYTISVTIDHEAASPATVTDSATVSDPSVNATGGFSLTAAEGSSTGTQTVATFTDPGGAEPVADYSATITWGDGSTSAGTITFNSTNSTFTVSSSHTYAEEGGYGIAVTIHHDSASPVTVNDSATVSDPSVSATGGFSLTAAEGSSTGTQTVATFTDPGGPEPVANYSASVAWGDGTTTAGAISFNATNSTFTVSGSHTYAEEGGYGISVTIHHDSSSPVTVNDSATVSDPSVVAEGGFTITASEGTNSGTQTVATFTDPGGAEPLSDYSASIVWGDGQTTTNATISSTGSGGFAVTGDHTYTEEGSYTVSVTIHHDSAAPVTVTDTASVSDPSVNALGGITVSGTEGLTISNQTVAAFTDPAGPEPLTNYSATIAWGDGQTSAGIISQTGSGLFRVSGSHQYTEEGSFTIAVTIHHDQAADVTVTDTASIADPSVNATGGFTIRATEGVDTGLQTVATFTDPAGAEPLTDYSAKINWGDNTTSSGVITFDSGTGVFTVQGSHTYAEENTYVIAVTIHHDAAGDVTVFDSVNMSVNATGGFTVTAAEGANSGSQTVATFTDPNGPEPVSNYSATINWGDGSTSAGTITFNSTTSVFTVSGSHTYAEEGTDSITVTIQNDTAGTTQVTSTAQVSDPAVVATGGFTVNSAEGSSTGSQTVATFTDPGGPEPVANYAASISWGDGSSSSGTITFNTATGVFTVSGSHTYAEEGTDTITVTIHHDTAPDASVSSTAQVSDPAVVATGGFTVTAAEGSSSGSQTVATFTDPAGPEPVANYSATIAWGDGATSSGTITFNTATGVFTVSGSHTYAEEGSDTITVTINHETAPAVSVTSTAQIADVAVVATGGFNLQSAEKSSTGTQTVATFTDPAGAEPVTNYSANISWGDESSSAGTITFDSGTGVFTVAGSHTYAEQGTFTISTTIQHETASLATVTSSALVHLVSDIAGRVQESGDWWVAASNGSTAFSNSFWGHWDPTRTWVDVLTGDFNGDGRTDYVGRDAQTGQVWVALSTGSSFTTTLWTTWNPNVTWADVRVGDFTGDGKDDLVGRVAENGQIWVGTSTGSSFINTLWTTWYAGVTWADVRVGDFTGDGKADVAGRVQASGDWWVAQSSGSSFTNIRWTTWDPSVNWVDVQVGDFNGDGKADIAGRDLAHGAWWVAVSSGSSFSNSLWTIWDPTVTWVDVRVGDFNGDGKADLVGRIAQNGQIWVSLSTAESFTTSMWTTWDPTVTWVDVQVGDFNGDGKADIAGRDQGHGAWWVGLSNGSTTFTTTLWTVWDPMVTWVDVHAGDFA